MDGRNKKNANANMNINVKLLNIIKINGGILVGLKLISNTDIKKQVVMRFIARKMLKNIKRNYPNIYRQKLNNVNLYFA